MAKTAPWFMSVSGKPEVKLILVDKPMADEALARNTLNRKMAPRVVKKYRSKMHAMHWYVTNQGIGFYIDGTLADGQHRLEAISQSGLAQLFVVVTGIAKEAAMAIDDLRVRSESDRLKIGGADNDNLSNCVAMIRAISELTRTRDQHATLLTEDIAEIIDAFEKELAFVIGALPKKVKGIAHSATRGAILTAVLNGVSIVKISRFCDILSTGTDAEKDEAAAIRLREFLLTAPTGGGSSARKEIFLKTQRALKAFLDGHSITRLHMPEIPLWACDFLFDDDAQQKERAA